MLTVSLDVHAGASQMAVVDATGEVIREQRIATTPEALARAVDAVPGPKRVVFEQGPMARLIRDALTGRCEEIICADPAHNALIARAEDASDERDARRLATLAQVKSVRAVYVPGEPYRSLRALQVYGHQVERAMTAVKNRITALLRSQGVRYRGRQPYGERGRTALRRELTSPAIRWQLDSLYRRLESLAAEKKRCRREVSKISRGLPVLRRLRQIPGVGPVTALVLVAWIADPHRFRSPSALSSYAGLGIGQGSTNWKPVGRARASKRGNRELKRILFLAARAAGRSQSALGRRHRARLDAGWDISKVRRDIARTILKTAVSMWRNQTDYDEGRITVPCA